MPRNTVSASRVSSTWRTAHKPTMTESTPRIASRTRVPPVRSSAASAATNLKMPETINWIPNSTASTSSVSLGQTSTVIPATGVSRPYANSQPQCLPKPGEHVRGLLNLLGHGALPVGSTWSRHVTPAISSPLYSLNLDIRGLVPWSALGGQVRRVRRTAAQHPGDHDSEQPARHRPGQVDPQGVQVPADQRRAQAAGRVHRGAA